MLSLTEQGATTGHSGATAGLRLLLLVSFFLRWPGVESYASFGGWAEYIENDN
jgi:hypothetical protein